MNVVHSWGVVFCDMFFYLEKYILQHYRYSISLKPHSVPSSHSKVIPIRTKFYLLNITTKPQISCIWADFTYSVFFEETRFLNSKFVFASETCWTPFESVNGHTQIKGRHGPGAWAVNAVCASHSQAPLRLLTPYPWTRFLKGRHPKQNKYPSNIFSGNTTKQP